MAFVDVEYGSGGSEKSLLELWNHVKGNSASVTMNTSANSIDFGTTGLYFNEVVLYKSVDVTNISTIKVTITSSKYSGASYSNQDVSLVSSGISISDNTYTREKSASIITDGQSHVITLDVSSYIGIHQLAIDVSATSGSVSSVIVS